MGIVVAYKKKNMYSMESREINGTSKNQLA